MKTKGIFLVINEKNETFSLTKIRPKNSTFGRKKKGKVHALLMQRKEQHNGTLHEPSQDTEC
jgi:hypothetical protein